MKCNDCNNYLSKLDTCKFCSYEPSSLEKREFDILKLDEFDGWVHIQLLERLHDCGIDCLTADVWGDDNCAYLLGCYASPYRIANALNMQEEAVYGNTNSGIVVLNLFQEKYLRGELDG